MSDRRAKQGLKTFGRRSPAERLSFDEVFVPFDEFFCRITDSANLAVVL
jgi:hypothetical protein